MMLGPSRRGRGVRPRVGVDWGPRGQPQRALVVQQAIVSIDTFAKSSKASHFLPDARHFMAGLEEPELERWVCVAVEDKEKLRGRIRCKDLGGA
ncbi:hypothetical protein ACQRIU_002950 [Beauveria bassiana]